MWKFKNTAVESQEYIIDDINIWDFKWEATDEKVKLKDPLYGQHYSFDVYKIQNGDVEIIFCAREFSNGIWGIYLKENNLS